MVSRSRLDQLICQIKGIWYGSIGKAVPVEILVLNDDGQPVHW